MSQLPTNESSKKLLRLPQVKWNSSTPSTDRRLVIVHRRFFFTSHLRLSLTLWVVLFCPAPERRAYLNRNHTPTAQQFSNLNACTGHRTGTCVVLFRFQKRKIFPCLRTKLTRLPDSTLDFPEFPNSEGGESGYGL
jgi:hypothetical protein